MSVLFLLVLMIMHDVNVVGVSDRAKSRLSRTPSKEEDGTNSAQGTPSKKPGSEQKTESRSSFFATLDWSEESSNPATNGQEGAPPAQRSEAQVNILFVLLYLS